jgi:5-methylcytosine-specific restriction enzyme subunit McrC
MLNEAKEVDAASLGNAPIRLQRTALLDAFVVAFCRELEGQLVQGLLREYVLRRENLSLIRGKLRIDLQFKHNLAHQERLYCEYDELSANFRVNQFIKGVLRRLAGLPLGSGALRRLRELLLRFDEVADVNPTVTMLDEIPLDRATGRYTEVLRQSRWFLNGTYPDVAVGSDSAAALLFDMNKLFEACVIRASRREAWKRGLRLHAHGPPKWFALEISKDKQMFAMKPDITIRDPYGSTLLVADAKWKLLDEDETRFGIAESDLYQLAAYAVRYSAAGAALIYPKQQRFSKKRVLGLYRPQLQVQLIPFDVVERSLHELNM